MMYYNHAYPNTFAYMGNQQMARDILNMIKDTHVGFIYLRNYKENYRFEHYQNLDPILNAIGLNREDAMEDYLDFGYIPLTRDQYTLLRLMGLTPTSRVATYPFIIMMD